MSLYLLVMEAEHAGPVRVTFASADTATTVFDVGDELYLLATFTDADTGDAVEADGPMVSLLLPDGTHLEIDVLPSDAPGTYQAATLLDQAGPWRAQLTTTAPRPTSEPLLFYVRANVTL